jgi:hypothetical protein
MVAWRSMYAVETAVANQWREGGQRWAVVVPQGDGITSPADGQIVASWQGDAVQQAYPREASAQPAVPAESLPYTVTGLAPLPPRCELIGTTGMRLAIGALLHSEGYYQYAARRLADTTPPIQTELTPGMGAAFGLTWTTTYGL